MAMSLKIIHFSLLISEALTQDLNVLSYPHHLTISLKYLC